MGRRGKKKLSGDNTAIWKSWNIGKKINDKNINKAPHHDFEIESQYLF